MPAQLTQADFISLAQRVHGIKYDYSLVKYVNFKTKVVVVCGSHGPFLVAPHLHTSNKTGCPDCAYGNRATSSDEFIRRCRALFVDQPLDYSNTNYRGLLHPITVECGIHGPFTKSRASMLLSSKGCPWCAKRGNGQYRWRSYKASHPEELTKPVILYLYEFRDKSTGERFCKIGVTKHSTKIRFRGYNRFDKVRLCTVTVPLQTGLEFEEKVSSGYSHKRTVYVFKEHFNGKTECYDFSPTDILNLANDMESLSEIYHHKT